MDVLTLEDAAGQATDVRWELVSPSLAVIGEVDISKEDVVTIENNSNRAIKRQVSGMVIPPHQVADIDVFRDRLRPVWLVADPVTEAVLEYPLGVFTFASLSRTRERYHATEGTAATADMGDLLVALDQPLERSVSYGPGYVIESAIAEQAALAGVVVTDIEPTGKRIGTPVAWVAGRDTRLKVVNELAALAGFYSPWFDNSGVFVARQVPELGDEPATFNYDSPPRIYDGTIVETDDALNAPNRYVVVDTSATASPISAFYDIPASAPHSVANRGYPVVRVVEVQGLQTVAQAQQTARAAAAQDAAGYTWADVQTIPEPRMDTYDVVQFDLQLWRVQTWKLTLAPGGPMAQSWRRVYN